jgi:hypothetical protein
MRGHKKQFCGLVLAQPAVAALPDPAILGHPVLQLPRDDHQVPGHLRDRLTRLPHQADRALLECLVNFLRVLASPLLT